MCHDYFRVIILHDYLRINCSIKWIAFTKRVWTRYDIWCQTVRINCIIKKIARMNVALLIDSQIRFAVWFDHDFNHLFVIIKRWSSRDIDMIIRINCSIKWNAFTEHVQFWTRHDIECKMCYWYQVRSCCTAWLWRLVRDLIISVIVSLSMSMCSSWYVSFNQVFSSLLTLTSSRSKTRKTFEYNYAMSSFFEYFE